VQEVILLVQINLNPFELIYVQEVILLVQINLNAL
jgi:hypothetical protein